MFKPKNMTPYRESYKPNRRTSWLERFEPFLIHHQWYRKKIGGPWVHLVYNTMDIRTEVWFRGPYLDKDYCELCKTDSYYCDDSCAMEWPVSCTEENWP
jgi:hypothetical protein